jgi:hypothetical protein
MTIEPVGGSSVPANLIVDTKNSDDVAASQTSTADSGTMEVTKFDHIAQQQMDLESGLFSPALFNSSNMATVRHMLEDVKKEAVKVENWRKKRGSDTALTEGPLSALKQREKGDGQTGNVAFFSKGPAAEPLPGPYEADAFLRENGSIWNELEGMMSDVVAQAMLRTQLTMMFTLGKNTTKAVETLIKGQ